MQKLNIYWNTISWTEREGQRVPCDRAGNCWPKV